MTEKRSQTHRIGDAERAAALTASLAGRYVVERELGRGGMATVYLARDVRHKRSVAIKVLDPELSQLVGAGRFLREIELAANLQHPHVVPLFDSGEAARLLYYVMPFVEGESLRDRLTREGKLAVQDAVRLTSEVAGALDYAHAHGVVHRDIKPENILLTSGRALIADFGVARALRRATQGAEGETLTGTGVVVGTPSYMSPEQALGDKDVGAPSDIYSLGCVAYEMLAGEAPFGGASGQAIARRFTEPVPAASARRPELSRELDEVLRRALDLNPAERFATAGEFARALEAALGARSAPGAARLRSHGRSIAISAALLAVFTTAVLVVELVRRSRTSTRDPKVIAVLPFRVTGADRSLGYLREGMVDLLATKLTGSGGFRAVDSRSLLSAWRRAGGSGDRDLTQGEALALARRLGVGQLLQGEVVGSLERLVISATLLQAPGGTRDAQTSVQGPPDSLPALVDRLAATLLSLGAGEGEQRVAALTSTSLPALRAYLEGRALYRAARFQDAVARYEAALQFDSTFALAALGELYSAGWGATANVDRAERIAWQYRQRLSARDRTLLEIRLGPRYPVPATIPERFAAAERAVALAPDDPDAWDALADEFYHFGAHLEIDDAHLRALAAFRRELTLDSTTAPLLEHLPVLEGQLGDTASVRRSVALLTAHDSTSEMLDFHRWYGATVLADSAALRRFRPRIDAVSRLATLHIAAVAVDVGVGLDDADRLMAQVMAKSLTAAEEAGAKIEARFYFMNRGRLGQARRFVIPLGPDSPWAQAATLLDAMFWRSDTAAARLAEAELAHSLDAPSPPGVDQRLEQGWSRFAVAQYRLTRNETATARRVSTMLRAVSLPADSAWRGEGLARLALLLDAQVAAMEGHDEAPTLLARLDSSLRNAPATAAAQVYADAVGNLVASRLWEERGNLARALAAARRWQFGSPLVRRPCISSNLREEGRIAALMGDRARAIRVYRHYLALRADADPPLRGEREHVRAELARLEGQ